MRFPRPIAFVGLFLTLPFSAAWAAAESRVYHVAVPPLGDDAHDGTAAAPFATLDRARRAVRALPAAERAQGDVVVTVQGGTYELAAPIHFDAADSGRDGAWVTYRAAPGETVTLSGGRTISGWAREDEFTFRANVGTDVDFRQLWVDDHRATRARTPNAGQMLRLVREKNVTGFELPPDLLAGVSLHPDEVEVSVLIAWMHKRLRISRLEDNGRATQAIINPLEWDAVTKQPQGDRVYLGLSYWLENAREFLDAPGEFFLDRSEGVLRYRPRPGEVPAQAKIIRPELENLIVLDGRLDAPVHHLRFEGFTFAHTGWTRPNRFGFVDVQANSLVPADLNGAVDAQYRHSQRKDRIPAAFQATTSDHIVLKRNRFARLGGTGVIFAHGGNDNVIEGNSFYDLAAGGIELGEDANQPKNPRLFPRRNRIANNVLAHLGEDYFGSVAILGYYTDASEITHNEISSLPYTAISQGWGWGLPLGPLDARANKITYNRITNYMRRLDDGGGIYTTDRQLGSEIAYNTLDLMVTPDPHSKAGGALYPDQFTEGFHLHHNVVTHALRWLYLWNPNIHGNRVDTNFADTVAQRNDAPDNVVEPVNLISKGEWPKAAQAIAANAGLQPAFFTTRQFAAPDAITVESTSVDFQTLTGEWRTTDASKDRYGGSFHASTDPTASACWMAILPTDGPYQVSVWRPAGSAAATFALHHDGDKTEVTLHRSSSEGAWETLGTFRFSAGAPAKITVRTAEEGAPLIADSVRFLLSRDLKAESRAVPRSR